MKWNPQSLWWEGNDQALRNFDAATVSLTRPVLIMHLMGSSISSPMTSLAYGARIVGKMMYALPCATCVNPVVVHHVDVKHELALGGLQRLLVPGHGGIDGINLEAARVELDDLLFEVICGDERVVAQVDVAGECKGKLTVCEELGWGVFMVEPLEDGFECIELLIEQSHNIW